MDWPLWHCLVSCLLLPWPTLAFHPYDRRSLDNIALRIRDVPLEATDDFFQFVTRPDIGAPRWDITIYDHDALGPGYWFVAPYSHLEQTEWLTWNGPHIYDSHGELIWSGAPMFDHYNVFDFRTVEVNGTHQFASLIFPDDEDGGGVIIDSSYEVYKKVNLLGDLPRTNMHDFTVVNDGARALTLTKVFGDATRKESQVVGFDGRCRAGWEGFKELTVNDSETLFSWSAEGRIGLDESTKRPVDTNELCSRGWDILHLNSIDKFPDGDYLLSARHTDALYKISHVDGSIVWRLGGVKSDFDYNSGSKFSRQHHARVRGQNETHVTISLFDNTIGDGEGEVASGPFSRGLVLSLDLQDMIATRLRQYDHPHHRHTNSRGSLSFLNNGNAFLGWTYGSLLSEHTNEGRILMDAHLRLPEAHTYRAYKLPWTGRPSQPPDVLSTRVDFGNGFVSTLIHVSWNGATDVDRWDVYSTDEKGRQRRLAVSGKRGGFETLLWHNGDAKYVVVEAVDAEGTILGHSNVTKTEFSEAPKNDPSFLPVVWSAISAAVAGIAAFCMSSWICCAWAKPRNWTWPTWRSKKRSVAYEPVARDDDDEVGRPALKYY